MGSLGVGEGDAVKLLGPVGTAKVGLGLEASDGICLVSLPQHDGKGLVVLPAPGQVDVGVQEVTEGGRERERSIGKQYAIHIHRVSVCLSKCERFAYLLREMYKSHQYIFSTEPNRTRTLHMNPHNAPRYMCYIYIAVLLYQGSP